MVVSSDSNSVTISLSSDPSTSVKILNYGATTISWKVAGQEKLWLSRAAHLDGSKAVRGGIPIAFPRFGAATGNHPATDKLPQHGFARSVTWEFLGEVNDTTAQFGLGPEQLGDKFREQWAYDFTVLFTVELLRDGQLNLKFDLENTDKTPFDFTVLFHTYYNIPDISKVSVVGFNGLKFYNKVLDADSEEKEDKILIAGEVDRVYKSTPNEAGIEFDGKRLYTIVSTPSLKDTVVWNPWQNGADGMADFAPKDGYKHMVCVENGAVANFEHLSPGSTWSGSATLKANF